MSDGFVALDAHIRRVRSVDGLAKDTAPEIAEEVEAELQRQIGAGENPSGQRWRPTLSGDQPLQSAGAHLNVGAVGLRILAVLRGHVARHHSGRARGGIQRQVLPQKMTPRIAKVIASTLAKRFRERMVGS